ncbi:hypothetical protein KKC22_17585 [Myxococcota bacterium]|nr:hypothetical protein [Myxococcota bacterium]
MTDHPVDFSPLNPRRDPDRFDGMIRHVVEQGMPQPAAGLPWGLSLLFGPALAASLVLILVFGVLSTRPMGQEDGTRVDTGTNTGEFSFASWAGADPVAGTGGPAVSGGLDAWQELEMLRR